MDESRAPSRSTGEEFYDGALAPVKRVFVVGSPRSGTTWLQLLLYQHPLVASAAETHLFDQYLNRVEERWKHEAERSAAGYAVQGLSRSLSSTQFYELCRVFADAAFAEAFADAPRSTVWVEKSPEHGLQAELILKVFPDAYFIHLIRDPRSVASSFRHAGGSWWKHAPTGPIEVTRRWRNNVEQCRDIGRRTDRYIETRYEALLEDGSPQLRRLFDWLDLPADDTLCRNAIEACAIDNLKGAGDSVESPWALENDPSSFYRHGKAAGWRTELSRQDLAIVEHVAGDLMRELGYERETRPAKAPSRLLLHATLRRLRSGLRRLFEGIDWRLRDLAKRL